MPWGDGTGPWWAPWNRERFEEYFRNIEKAVKGYYEEMKKYYEKMKKYFESGPWNKGLLGFGFLPPYLLPKWMPRRGFGGFRMRGRCWWWYLAMILNKERNDKQNEENKKE